MLIKHFALIISLCAYSIKSDYISADEPDCRENCLALNETQIDCLNQMINFYTYKYIKGVFNFGKSAIYAGLWAKRSENPDLNLFEDVFKETLKKYNNPELLGDLSYEELVSASQIIFDSFKNYTLNKPLEEKYNIPYASLPSLKCPTLCSYDILTWKTLFYISLSIFILALITISLYTLFLRKQYKSLKSRLKVIKYTKVSENNE